MERKNDRVVILIMIATFVVLSYLIYFNIKKNTKIEIMASVKEVGNNYVMIVDENENEYRLNIDDKYEIGDKVNVVLKNIKEGNPKTGDVVKIDTISRNVEFVITDVVDSDNVDNSGDSSSDLGNVDIDSNYNPLNNSEVEIVNYFNDFSNEIDNTEELKNSIKEKFVLVVDFLFYDGTIKEKTFKELSEKSKFEVLQIFLKIDSKMEKKFPGYKDTISSTGNKMYSNAKNKALEVYFDLTSSVCSNDPALCEIAKDGLSELKNNISLTWEFVKKMAGVGISKLKSWYEIWREI